MATQLFWYEGIVLSVSPPATTPSSTSTTSSSTNSKTYTCKAYVVSEGYVVSNIQLPITGAIQTLPAVGQKIVFYRDSCASARYAFSISDVPPVRSPIMSDTVELSQQLGSDVFAAGEFAAAAAGDPTQSPPLNGAQLWLKNSGDGILASGTYSNKIEVSDSTDSIDIVGNNLDFYANGNLVYTQAVTVDQDVLGNITLEMGQCNPETGIFLSSFSCNPDGSWSLFHLPTLSGISFNPIPSLPATLETPQIQLTSNPLTSQLTVNQLGTTIFALLPATIDLIGTTTFSGPTIFTEPAIFEEISFTLENPLVPPTGTVPVVIAVPAVILDVPVVIEGAAAGPADGYLAATLAGVPIQIPYYLA